MECLFRNVEDGFAWEFAVVYEPNYDCERRYLREELAWLSSWWEVSWCIKNDFNGACVKDQVKPTIIPPWQFLV